MMELFKKQNTRDDYYDYADTDGNDDDDDDDDDMRQQEERQSIHQRRRQKRIQQHQQQQQQQHDMMNDNKNVNTTDSERQSRRKMKRRRRRRRSNVMVSANRTTGGRQLQNQHTKQQQQDQQQHHHHHHRHITKGNVTALLLLVQFADHVDRNLPPKSYYERLCNNNNNNNHNHNDDSDTTSSHSRSGESSTGGSGSIHDYFWKQSYGQYNVSCYVMDWITLNDTEEYYASNKVHTIGRDQYAIHFVKPVLSKAFGNSSRILVHDDDDAATTGTVASSSSTATTGSGTTTTTTTITTRPISTTLASHQHDGSNREGDSTSLIMDENDAATADNDHIDNNDIVDFWKMFDSNNDGYIDLVLILHTGYGAEHGYECSHFGNKMLDDPKRRIHSQATIEPSTLHEPAWSYNYYYAYYDGEDDDNDDDDDDSNETRTRTRRTRISLYSYAIASAYKHCDDMEPTDIGIIAHEWVHTLGYNIPDLYDTSSSSSSDFYNYELSSSSSSTLGGLGSYDIMSNPWGPGNDLSYPGSMSPYTKHLVGWIDPIIIDHDGWYTLRTSTHHPDYYIIKNKGYPSGEYLLLENRQPLDYDSNIFGHGGLLIYHVDEAKHGQDEPGHPFGDNVVQDDQEQNKNHANDWPTDGSHYKVALLQSDGNYDIERRINNGDSNDFYRPGRELQPGGNGLYPNSDSYQFGQIVYTGIHIYQISYDSSNRYPNSNGEVEGDVVSFRVDGLWSVDHNDAVDSGDHQSLQPTSMDDDVYSHRPSLQPTATTVNEPTTPPTSSYDVTTIMSNIPSSSQTPHEVFTPSANIPITRKTEIPTMKIYLHYSPQPTMTTVVNPDTLGVDSTEGDQKQEDEGERVERDDDDDDEEIANIRSSSSTSLSQSSSQPFSIFFLVASSLLLSFNTHTPSCGARR